MKTDRSLSFLSFIFIILFFTLNSNCSAPKEKPDGSSMGTVKDKDGNMYNTVKIGTQVWMKENMKTTKYNDGTEIPKVAGETQWSKLTTGAYCNYDNLESNATKYGRLYNWYAVSTGKLAPDGWHVPTDEDWTILKNYMIANCYNYDSTTSSNKIAKALAASTDWNSYAGTGTIGDNLTINNSAGFSALPSGCLIHNDKFVNIGDYGYWWSYPESNAKSARIRCLTHFTAALHEVYYYKSGGYSVRCIKD